jgi:hypothetical protein
VPTSRPSWTRPSARPEGARTPRDVGRPVEREGHRPTPAAAPPPVPLPFDPGLRVVLGAQRRLSALRTEKPERSARDDAKESARRRTAWAGEWDENPMPLVWHQSAEPIPERVTAYGEAAGAAETARTPNRGGTALRRASWAPPRRCR